MRFIAVFVYLSLFIALISGADDKCTWKSTAGNSYDLTKLSADSGGNDWTDQDMLGQKYFIAVCKNTKTECKSQPPTPVCQRDAHDSDHSCGSLESLTIQELANGSSSLSGLQITIKGGEAGRQTIIKVTCDESTDGALDGAVVEDPNSPGQYSINMKSKHACIGAAGGGGGGLIFIIIVLVLLAVYFIGGALFMKFARGASGVEMIPNYEFWTDLPGLVKDGFVFCINKVRGQQSGYQSV